MPFRVWFYGCKVFPLLLMAGALGMTYRHSSGLMKRLGTISIGALFLLGAIGALMGIYGVLFGLRMKCPVCDSYGEAGGARHGIVLRCPSCGLIRGGGILGLKLVRVPDPESTADRETP